MVSKMLTPPPPLLKRSGLATLRTLACIIICTIFLSLYACSPTPAPTPTPTTSPSTPTGENQTLWTGDWETGDTSQWAVHAGEDWGNSTVEVVQDPVRQGKYAGKFTVNPGENESERAEVSSEQEDTGGYPDQAWYYSWSTYIPSNPNKATGWDEWTDITQWMDLEHDCSPPMEVDIQPGDDHIPHIILANAPLDHLGSCEPLTKAREFYLGELTYDTWIDFTIHIKWSKEASVGFVEAWVNGKQVIPLTYTRTLATSDGVYMEQALYRPYRDGTNVLYHDGTHRHSAYVPMP